ncbi:MAG: T7SS effector LXG polymorphic toxin [Acutalibacteraceae bacterium]|nr:T7SS effector LXG polymorphic toxin [Acutalibacteraceae bacterium]
MSYKVNFDALDSLCININTQVSEWSSDINSISEKLNSILSGNHITGDGAENIKSYLQTVHVAIIQSLVSILQSHGQNCLMYKSDYQQNIDTSLHAVIKCEELFDIRNQLTTKRREMWSVDSNISDALTTVNDLIYNNLSSSDEMDELYGTINTSLLNLEGDIAELESNHLNTDFPEVQNMISALKIFINDQLSRSRAYLVEYTPQQLANSAVYADLFNANQVLVTSQSARADEFQIACEHENNRAELLEEEAAQIREEEGWWNAVAAVGTIVIGTVAIVCTAGMATPVVVTAVAAGSCSIAYGASNLVEAGQDIYYGSVGDATTVAFNPIRDTVFAGNQELYDIWGGISTTVAGFVVPVGQAYTTAKAAGSTTKVVVSTVGKAAAKEVAQDAFVSTVSLGTGNVVMDITGDANVSRLFSLGTGLFAGGKTNQALDSLDNVSSTVRRLDNLDNVTDVTKTLDDVTDSTKNIDDISSLSTEQITQRNIIDLVENIEEPIVLGNNMNKGNYGEMKMDISYESEGYVRISTDRVTDLDSVTHHGIDGVYESPTPPPKFIISEAKYGSSRLGNTNDGKQMCSNWIDNRLDDAVGKTKADEIRLEMLLNPENVESHLVNISKNGEVTRSLLDATGNVIK